MRQYRRFWNNLLLAVEDAFAAFSGVRPDLIAHSPTPRSATETSEGPFVRNRNCRAAPGSANQRSGRKKCSEKGEDT